MTPPEIIPAETIQVEHPMTHAFPLGWAIPLAALFGALFIIRTIPKREIAGWFAVFGLLAVVAAGFVVVAS